MPRKKTGHVREARVGSTDRTLSAFTIWSMLAFCCSCLGATKALCSDMQNVFHTSFHIKEISQGRQWSLISFVRRKKKTVSWLSMFNFVIKNNNSPFFTTLLITVYDELFLHICLRLDYYFSPGLLLLRSFNVLDCFRLKLCWISSSQTLHINPVWSPWCHLLEDLCCKH